MKIGLCIRLSVSRLFQVGHVIQNRRIEVQFRCLGTNGFHAKEKNERFTASSGSRCRQNLKTVILHLQHDYFSSFNQSNH